MGDGRIGKLLRGERAAVDAYENALSDVDPDGPAARILHLLLEDHRRALAALRDTAGREGTVDGDGAGPWGAFTRAVEKAAGWLGDRMALKALKEGEDHGVSEYRSALAREDLPPAVRTLVQDDLLPRQLGHVSTLDDLIRSLEAPERLRTLEDRVRAGR